MSELDVRDATRRYGTTAALDAVTLRVKQGTRAAIVGASGSGKTTLLRAIAGFERLDAGRIALDSRAVADADANVHVPAHLRGIGIVSQHGALFPHLDVARNIGFGLPRALRGPARAARVASLMDTVELDGALAARRPDALSGGQQQRVALARALARDPRVMLLDEPFSSLDTELRESVRRSIGAVLAAAGVTSVLVTHDRAEALGFADHVAVMRDGVIVQAGDPAELYAHPVDRRTALLLGEALVLSASLSGDVAICALGAVRLGTGGHSGVGEIMLRSEQLSLASTGRDSSHGGGRSIPLDDGKGVDAGGVEGHVTACEFTGPARIATVALSGHGTGEGARDGTELPSVRVRVPGAEAVAPGAVVRVRVHGSAHVFAALPA